MRKILFWPLMLLLISTAACGTQPAAPEASGPTPVVVRMLNLDLALTAMPPTTVPATITPAPSPTPFPTFTPMPTLAQAIIGPSATPACSNLVEFVRNLTINDGTALERQQGFAKLWQIRNAGTCTWTTAYQLVFVAGEGFSGPVPQALPMEVAPGQTLDLRLDLLAPAMPGAYVGSWMLQSPEGQIFGTGADGSQPLTVSIIIRVPPPKTPS